MTRLASRGSEADTEERVDRGEIPFGRSGPACRPGVDNGEGLATSTCGRSSPQVAWASRGRSTGTTSILDGMRVALMHDLDTPTALAVVDARAARGPAPAEGDLAAIDALLGIRL